MSSLPAACPPSVSIVIANYNYARFLRRSIDSALDQSYADVEVVVVDDSSDDNSADVIRAYGTRVKACLKQRNGGHAAAFNTGFAASSGDVVMTLDADDYLYPDAAASVVAAWTGNTALAQFRLRLVDGEEPLADSYPPPEVSFDAGDVLPELQRRGRYRTTVTSGFAFSREALDAVLPIPEDEFRQGADGYLATVAPVCGEVIALDACHAAYRQHGGNHSDFGGHLAERSRWRVQHDFLRLAALVRRAVAAGVGLPDPSCLMRDPQHLEERLASLCVDAAHHPVARDSRWRLARAGVAASLTMAASLRRRAMLAAWFLAAGTLPRPMACRVVSWKLDAASRPAPLARLFKAVRRAVG